MKGRHDGFSLVEVVAAIAILGIFFGTACSALVLGLRMNEKTDAKLQAQLAVSSAVEILMAEGIWENSELYELSPKKDENGADIENTFEILFNEEVFETPVAAEAIMQTETMEPEDNQTEPTVVPLHYYEVTVAYKDITVTTYIREAVTKP